MAIFLFAASASIYFIFIFMIAAHMLYSLLAHTSYKPKYSEEQTKIFAS